MSDGPIVTMDGVTVRGASAHVADLTELSLVLMPGDLVLLEPEQHVETVSFFDVVSGLIEPECGAVCFDGVDWRQMGLYGQSAARARIGRVFAIEGWVSNLNMMENIVLAQRHHTARSDSELCAAVRVLVERVGLRDCLSERPHALSRGERRRAQWVRAFLGAADLLLLNSPFVDVRPGEQSVLVDLLVEARARGAAVMWKSRDMAACKGQRGFEGARYGQLSGGQLLWPAAQDKGAAEAGIGSKEREK